MLVAINASPTRLSCKTLAERVLADDSIGRDLFSTQPSLRMKVIAAYLLAVLGGNTHPTLGNLKDIIESVGAEVDDDRIESLLAEVKGKDITELIASGREKFASVPSGGGAIAVAAPAAGGAAAPVAPEPKKEEKVEEKEESDDDMGFSLFD